MRRRLRIFSAAVLVPLLLGGGGCATKLPSLVEPAQATDHLVVGRAMAVLTGERSRRYLPSIRFLELEEQRSKERFQVEIESADDCFAIDIPPGTYRLTRVQISEGPFMSMADLIMTFSVAPGAVTYAGTWRFGVDSPRYGRLVVVSMIANEEERGRIREFLHKQYPNIQESVMVEGLPEPSQVEARLYEVMPYPRYSRYFRRHWW